MSASTGSNIPNRLVTLMLIFLAMGFAYSLWMGYTLYRQAETDTPFRPQVIAHTQPGVIVADNHSITVVTDPDNARVKCYILENESGRLAMSCIHF